MSAARIPQGRHPCFHSGAHHHFSRIHLPVAALCNVQCGFCDRRYSCVNESRPGVTAELLSPERAVKAAIAAAQAMPKLSVVGIAGPGDPLADAETTLRTLAAVRQALPHVMLCLSTNGLTLPLFAEQLAALGVSHVTVTVNAVTPATGARIYDWIDDRGQRRHGEEAATLLLQRQEQGIRQLSALGLAVKVNTVVMKDSNATEVPDIARTVATWGAKLMNCIPLLPVPGTRLAAHAPDHKHLTELQKKAERFLPQMRHCTRCRADAAGLLDDDGILREVQPPRACTAHC